MNARAIALVLSPIIPLIRRGGAAKTRPLRHRPAQQHPLHAGRTIPSGSIAASCNHDDLVRLLPPSASGVAARSVEPCQIVCGRSCSPPFLPVPFSSFPCRRVHIDGCGHAPDSPRVPLTRGG